MPYEERYPEDEFIEDDTPTGKDVTKELPPALEELLPHLRKRSH